MFRCVVCYRNHQTPPAEGFCVRWAAAIVWRCREPTSQRRGHFFRLVVTGHLRKPQRRDAAFELPKVRSWNSQSFMTKGAHNNLFLFLSNPVSLKILKACCTVYSWNPRHLVSNSYEVQLVSQDRWPEPKHCGCRVCIAGRGAICLSDLSAMATFEIWEYRWWLWNVGFQAAVAGNNTEVTCKQQCHVEMSDPTMPCHWIPDWSNPPGTEATCDTSRPSAKGWGIAASQHHICYFLHLFIIFLPSFCVVLSESHSDIIVTQHFWRRFPKAVRNGCRCAEAIAQQYKAAIPTAATEVVLCVVHNSRLLHE